MPIFWNKWLRFTISHFDEDVQSNMTVGDSDEELSLDWEFVRKEELEDENSTGP
jgi:hypothetical protein